MTKEQIMIVGLISGGALIVLGLIFLFVFVYPKLAEKERIRRQKVEEEYEKEPEYVFIKARVLSKRNVAYYEDQFHMPKQTNEYFVTFLTEEGEEREYPVRAEIFEELTEGQESNLVTVNGNFFYFGEGEDTEEENK